MNCILVDQAPFLTHDHVQQLWRSADDLGITMPLLRATDRFPAQFFRGSAALLALANALVELKAVCECGRKATMTLRVDEQGFAVAAGAQTEIGGEDS